MAKEVAPKKEWDEMTPEEQAIERKRLADAEAAANRPDPQFDQTVERQIKLMARVFKDQKKYPVLLFQITPSMKAEGQRELPPRECGINGYNFIVPRGILLSLPEGLIHVLHQAGEIPDGTMMQMGLMAMEEYTRKNAQVLKDAERLAQLGRAMGFAG